MPRKVISTANEQAPTTEEKPKPGRGSTGASILLMLRGVTVSTPNSQSIFTERDYCAKPMTGHDDAGASDEKLRSNAGQKKI
jgi:hypothetical protein